MKSSNRRFGIAIPLVLLVGFLAMNPPRNLAGKSILKARADNQGAPGSGIEGEALFFPNG
jgi:hypothetical protein